MKFKKFRKFVSVASSFASRRRGSIRSRRAGDRRLYCVVSAYIALEINPHIVSHYCSWCIMLHYYITPARSRNTFDYGHRVTFICDLCVYFYFHFHLTSIIVILHPFFNLVSFKRVSLFKSPL